MKGDASISSIYRQIQPERVEARREREARLFRLLWQKHGLFCIRAEDLPEDDILAQHVINIANQQYGRRNVAET